MNTGLGNLIELKRLLLAPALRVQTTYDTLITAIAQGVAARCEAFCNRKFARVSGDTYEFSADRSHVVLPRYPIESVTKLEQRDDITTGWVDQTLTPILNIHEAAGLVRFNSELGVHSSVARITYTGGYWFDSSETEDQTQPDGSTKLPGDLKLAWHLMIRRVWESVDKTGSKITAVGPGSEFVTGTLPDLDLPPEIASLLNPYRRFQLS